MSELIISVSGLRGIVGDSLTPEIAVRYVAAFASTLHPGPVVITRDGRQTGPMLASAVSSALLASGCACLDAGVAATPTTGVLVRHHAAAGGIQISASHNPPEYNGIKLFDRTGRVIPAAAGQRVIDAYTSSAPRWKPFDAIGSSYSLGDSVTAHLAMVAAICDVDRIRGQRFRVLLDSNNGSGSVLGIPLLEELGCDATVLGADPDGQFSHPPEPTAENLESITKLMQAAEAQIGFCQDPDADRLAVIDERGCYIGEECTLAICVNHVLRHTPGPVVINCSTSRMTEDIAEKYDVPLFRTKVGEANVVDTMLAESAVFGGEGNGGVIDPRVGLVRDSFVGMALILDAMAERQMPVSALADELPRYAIHKSKVGLAAENVTAGLATLERHFPDARPDYLDGLRLDWPNKWLLVRASNTEPIVRIIAEAPTAEEARQLCTVAAQVVSTTG